jgi:N-acetylneuraminic acid mutarotase/predicted Ser/Thr protein kinase
METMFGKRVCRQCSAEVPGGELEGLCTACVAATGFVLEPDELEQGECDFPGKTRVFGDYELLEEIARGGMGIVYKACQLSLNRVVAVKMILTGQLASPADVQRFRAEAEAAANLQHPNIVAIHEVGEHEGQHYFSMDYVEGNSLAQLVEGTAGSKRDFRQAAEWVRTLALAIDYAHEQGTLHRDLKPSNVLINKDGRPLLTDFGLAKRAKFDSDLTISGQIIGTPNFMPPEQAAARRAEIGPASDIYSLGAMLYFTLTGRPPFAAATTHETMTKVLHSEPVSPRALQPTIPRDLATICLKCLEKAPGRRYATGRQLAEDLERFLKDQPILARPVGWPEQTWRVVRRHPVTSALLLAVLLLVGVEGAKRFSRPRVPSLPVLVGDGLSCLLDGKLYVTIAADGYAGNRNYLFAYDSQRNTWDKLPSSPLPAAYCGAGVIGGNWYLAGGTDWKGHETNQLSMYEPRSNSWTLRKSMPTPRQNCAGLIYSGRLYVLGGQLDGKALNTVEAYDPATDSWSTTPPMLKPRVNPQVALVGSKFYVFAGNSTNTGRSTVSAECFDAATGVWSFRADIPISKGAAAVAAYKGLVYLAGGNTPDGESDTLLEYNTETDQWRTLAPMPASGYGGAGAQVIDGKIWVIGGWTSMPGKRTHDPQVAHNEIFLYDPVRNRWSVSGSTDQ